MISSMVPPPPRHPKISHVRDLKAELTEHGIWRISCQLHSESDGRVRPLVTSATTLTRALKYLSEEVAHVEASKLYEEHDYRR